MRLFPLLAFCLIFSLTTPLFAYTTHRTTHGPLSMHFGTTNRIANKEIITELDQPLKLTATLENRSDAALPVRLTFRTIETFGFLEGEQTFSQTTVLSPRSTADVTVNVIARAGTYTAHYPVRLDAEFELDGEIVTAHIIQVIETE